MKTTFVLMNTGDESPALVSLQISYFFNSGQQVNVESQEFPLSVTTNQESVQEVDFGDFIVEEQEVFVIIKRVNGNIITQQSFLTQKLDGQTVEIQFALNKEVQLENPQALVELTTPSFVYGRLLDKKGLHNMEEVQLIILAQKTLDGEFEPITSVKTEAQGYFAVEYPLGSFLQAVAQVGLELVQNPVPIRLEEKTVDQERTELVFPRRVILVVEFLEEEEPPKIVEEDCGCSSLKFDGKRVLEEFSYYSLVRTSDPAIKGVVLEEEQELTLEDVLRNLPFTIFELIEPIRALPIIAQASPLETGVLNPGIALAVPAPNAVAQDNDVFLEKIRNIKIQKKVLQSFLNDEKVITKENIEKLFVYNESARFQEVITAEPVALQPLGRVVLNDNNAVDWDEEPTIYQAVEIAHGHLLQFKSEWIDDGHSPGDLIYSLPLAPGQKKNIVVFDWERRESASNIQSVDFEESLFNSLSRDRDIFEIAQGTISESIRGSSRATTGGASGGIGGIVGGVLFGVSGGFGTSSSKASQDSFRQISSSDQQKLRDRIVQSANAVRSMRSTVIQTVAQGERFEVSAETVANYNHCHALTIQYFEVLRHFKIRQRFVEARECLFIPLLMGQFNLKKALRWREALQPALLDKRMGPAFDAADRVEHEWKDSDFPSGTFASENILTASGLLNAKIVLRRPVDKIEEVEDKSRPVVTVNGVSYPFTKKVYKIIPENWTRLQPFLGSLNVEQFYEEYLAEATDKDAVFHRELGEKIARGFFDLLAFQVADETGNTIGTVPIDASVTSRYRRDGVLKVTLRLNQPTSFSRDKFHYLQIKSKAANIDLANVLPEGSYITVESAFLRYRSKHFNGFLFNYQYLGDDLTESNGVTIYAGPSNEELKDPRKEDVVLVNKLIDHLNDNLEHYHKTIWLSLTLERRFMLLDGMSLDGKGEGRSVASLVENELIGIVGNSLVFPVAPGLNLNPDFGLKESLTDFYMVAAAEPISVSVPTKGVYAEAVMGQCNSCEEKDESRFWRWEESPIPDSPTAILPIDTTSRRAEPGNLQPAALPNPIVNIQNAPNAPDPSGLGGVLQLLGKGDSFRDITGLTENQKNALAALQSTLETAKAFGQEAAKLEIQKSMERRLDTALNKIKNSGLPADKQADLTEKAINAYLGGGAKQEEKPKTDQQKAEGAKSKTSVIKDAVDTGVISPKVGEHLAAASLQHALFGASEEVTPGTIDAQELLSNPALIDKDIEFENDTFRVSATGPSTSTGSPSGGSGSPSSVSPFSEKLFPTEMAAVDAHNTRLRTAIDTVRATLSNANKARLDNVSIIICKLVPRPGVLEYAGVRELDMFFSGSLLKVALLYASFELVARVNTLAPLITASSVPDFFAKVNQDFEGKIADAVPDIPAGPWRKVEFTKVLTATADASGVFSVKMSDVHRRDLERIFTHQRQNVAARECIRRLGFSYLNGALAAAGFLGLVTQHGIWLASDFVSDDPPGPGNWRSFHVPVSTHGTSSAAMTTQSMADLLTKIFQEELVDTASSQAMRDIYAKGDAWLSTLPIPNQDAFSFISTGAKVGHSSSTSAKVGSVMSEAAFLQRKSDSAPFVAVWQNVPDPLGADPIYHVIDEVVKHWP